MLVEHKRLGETEDEMLFNYPGLTHEDLAAAWAYYEANREEIETAIRENHEA
jgi:uncharacterized protein (DUF433 family)